ncbi:hypothetical protein ACFFQ7_07390 [Roseibacillus persicicus]
MSFLLALVVYPYGGFFAHLGLIDIGRKWLDVGLLFLSFLGFIGVLVQRKNVFLSKRKIIAISCIIVPVVVSVVLSLIRGLRFYDPSAFFTDIKIFALAISFFIVVLSGAHIRKNVLIVSSLLLALLVYVSFGYDVVVSGEGKPFVSGEPNYDAILLTLCLFLFDASTQGRNCKNSHQIVKIVLLVAIVLTFSRTSLLLISFGLGLKIFSQKIRVVSMITILVLAVVVAGGIYFSFVGRGLAFDLNSLDRAQMFIMYGEIVKDYPVEGLFGFGVSSSVDASLVPKLEYLWEKQMVEMSVDGVSAFMFHGFWLRWAFCFGMLSVLLFWLVLVVVFVKGSTYKRSVVFGFWMSSFFMGSLYLSAVSWPFLYFLFKEEEKW